MNPRGMNPDDLVRFLKVLNLNPATLQSLGMHAPWERPGQDTSLLQVLRALIEQAMTQGDERTLATLVGRFMQTMESVPRMMGSNLAIVQRLLQTMNPQGLNAIPMMLPGLMPAIQKMRQDVLPPQE